MMGAEFYVYELIDPRSMVAFYVGKGCKDRMHQHEIAAKRGERSRKCDLIRQIHDSGLEVIKGQVAFFFDEQDAYDFETERIAEYGLENLTNVLPGGQKAWAARQEVMRRRNLERKYLTHQYLRFLAIWIKAWNGVKRDFSNRPYAEALWRAASSRSPVATLKNVVSAVGIEKISSGLQRFGVELQYG